MIKSIHVALIINEYSDRKNDNHVTGLYASVRITQYVWEDCYIYGAYDKEKSSMIGMYTGSSIATRLAYILGFTGPCLTFDGACASSLAGIHLAVRSLQCGDCDHCIVAAASILIVTHNNAIQAMVDKIIVIKDGEIVSDNLNSSKISARLLEYL